MAETLITIIEYYCYVGLFTAAIFLVFGIERVEPGSRGSYAFRPLLIPGLMLLWPLVLYRWYQLETKDKPS